MTIVRRRPLMILVFFLLLPQIAATSEGPPEQGKVSGTKETVYPDWFKESFLDIAADASDSAQSDKHLMLFLEMNGCPYCYRMIEENFKHAPYTDFIKEHFDVVALNVRGDREVALDADTTATEKEIAEALKVRYTPTIIFLDSQNRPVARVNGYRNVADFKQVLDYVQQKAYEKETLAQYVDAHKASVYKLRDHPQLKDIRDLHAAADRPLAVLFEDAGCTACDALHDGYLEDPEVNAVLERFTFVRLDALSEEPIVDVDGNHTTPKAWAESLGLTYRPGWVLFDQGREIARIDAMLYRYHFLGVLEYVGERHYQEYPGSPFQYIDAKTAELLKQGKDVNIAE